MRLCRLKRTREFWRQRPRDAAFPRLPDGPQQHALPVPRTREACIAGALALEGRVKGVVAVPAGEQLDHDSPLRGQWPC